MFKGFDLKPEVHTEAVVGLVKKALSASFQQCHVHMVSVDKLLLIMRLSKASHLEMVGMQYLQS